MFPPSSKWRFWMQLCVKLFTLTHPFIWTVAFRCIRVWWGCRAGIHPVFFICTPSTSQLPSSNTLYCIIDQLLPIYDYECDRTVAHTSLPHCCCCCCCCYRLASNIACSTRSDSKWHHGKSCSGVFVSDCVPYRWVVMPPLLSPARIGSLCISTRFIEKRQSICCVLRGAVNRLNPVALRRYFRVDSKGIILDYSLWALGL